jgi:hypothetical protein
MENLFLLASRSKFRFNTTSGVITTEDLWDLPLTDSRKANLDDVAKDLNRQLKEANQEQSFVKPSAPKTNEIQAKFDLVLAVIKTKMEERDTAKALADKLANKQKIMALIDKKKDEALAGKSLDELQSLVNAM